MEEIWKDIKGYEGYYQVSSLGKVKRLKNTVIIKRCGVYYSHTHPERLLNPSLNKDGYYRTELSFSEKRVCIFCHRLVALTFIPNPLNKKEVNHINGIKTDNRVENLEWATPSENVKHGFFTGLITRHKGERCGASKLKEFQVLEIRKDLKNKLPLSIISNKFNVTKSAIYAISVGRTWKHIQL